MARSYSLDLREKVAAFVDRGRACREAARVFGVSPSFVVKMMARRRATGSLAALPRGGRRGKLDPHHGFLVAALEEQPDQTMPELAAKLLVARGVQVAPASLSRFLIRIGLTRKKRRCSPRSTTAPTSRPSAGPGSSDGSRACAQNRGG